MLMAIDCDLAESASAAMLAQASGRSLNQWAAEVFARAA